MAGGDLTIDGYVCTNAATTAGNESIAGGTFRLSNFVPSHTGAGNIGIFVQGTARAELSHGTMGGVGYELYAYNTANLSVDNVVATGTGTGLYVDGSSGSPIVSLGQKVDLSGVTTPIGGYTLASMTQGQGIYTSTATTGTDTVSQPNAQADVITSAAVITASTTVNVPAKLVGLTYAVYNNTSGAFTWSVGVTGGTAITVAQGKHAIVTSDGTNMIRVSPDT